LSQTVTFFKKHWLTLFLLIGSLVAVNWIVKTKRAPGSMTVIEAQGMDMTDMKAPVGTQPVSVESVKSLSLGGSKSFPATIAAFSDEDVVARIPGRVSRILAYPGDRVSAGQLLATIDAPEYDAEQRKAVAMSGAKSAEVISAEREIEHHRNILAQAQATVKAAEIARSRAQTDAEAAELELQKAHDELAAKQSEVEERQADLTYADKDLARRKNLYDRGAVSLNEVQARQRDRDAAKARLDFAQAALQSASQSVGIAGKRVTAAGQMVAEADTAITAAKAEAGQAQEGIAQAHADASARRFESSAAGAEVAGAATLADYRQLRALGSGVVAERVVSPGTPIMAGQVVLRLKSVGKVRVQADLPQSLSSSIRTGMPVRILGDSLDKTARLTSVFPSVEAESRTFRVEAVVDNTDGSLKPGMFVHLEIGGSGEKRLAVRSVAIQSDDTSKYVWIVKQKAGTGKTDWTCTMHPEVSMPGPGKCPKCGMDLTQREKGGSLAAHRQPVTAGPISGDYTSVVSGLHQGDRVIWQGFENLIEGSPVQPDGADAKQPPPEPSGAMPGMDMQESKPKAPVASAKEVKADYTCPMHPEVHSDKPGKCPKCGMDLVKRTAAK